MDKRLRIAFRRKLLPFPPAYSDLLSESVRDPILGSASCGSANLSSDPCQTCSEMLMVKWLVGLFQVWVRSAFHQHPDSKMWINSKQALVCVQSWKPHYFRDFFRDLGLLVTWVEAPLQVEPPKPGSDPLSTGNWLWLWLWLWEGAT